MPKNINLKNIKNIIDLSFIIIINNKINNNIYLYLKLSLKIKIYNIDL